MNEELKPCPFCGSSDIKAKQGKTLMLHCQGCGAVMFDYEDGAQRDVRAAWNRRASPALIGLPVIAPEMLEVGK